MCLGEQKTLAATAEPLIADKRKSKIA